METTYANVIVLVECELVVIEYLIFVLLAVPDRRQRAVARIEVAVTLT